VAEAVPALSSVRKALLAAALVAAAQPAYAADGAPPTMMQTALVAQASDELKGFYFHNDHPLWISDAGAISPAADKLLQLINTAQYDGLDPQALGVAQIEAAVQEARANPTQDALVRAELALTSGLTRYVEAMVRQSPGSAMHYEHDILRPIEPTTDTVVLAAAAAPSLEEYVGQMRWMHPLYAQIRQALITPQSVTALQSAAITSLQRVRDIPAPVAPRHVVIDIPSATLWMYEGNQVVDSMRVVVGKADTQTPQMAGWIRYATLNPYWNVPPHLIRKTIAPNVKRQGIAYLRTRGYEVLSDWSDAPTVLDPTTIDWTAVAAGTLEIRVRQKPNSINSMGKVKYEFPNPQGIYLHDTPEKQLLREPARQFSNGCIRLEDAARFGRWLFEGAMPQASGPPEERVDIAVPVPIYVTYLTVKPEGGQLALGTDPYGLDGTAPTGLARLH